MDYKAKNELIKDRYKALSASKKKEFILEISNHYNILAKSVQRNWFYSIEGTTIPKQKQEKVLEIIKKYD